MGITTAVAPPTPPRATHREGYALFLEIMRQMHEAGWQRLRVDTYVHPRLIWTVRHHYCHDEWEFYYEPDRYWHPHGTEGKLVRVRLNRPPLPSAEQIITGLLGPDVSAIWPAHKGEQVWPCR